MGNCEEAWKDDALDLRGVVEPALAEALMLAARAGRWELVEQLAHELAKRRQSREGGQAAVSVPERLDAFAVRHRA